MKPLAPTLRATYRYVAFVISCPVTVRPNELQKATIRAAKSLFGDVGVSALAARIVLFDGKKGLLRCDSRYVDEAQAVCASIAKIRDNQLCVATLGTSGTIKAATEKYLQIE
jgi:ribonuclease P/MRP protein subunit POP5